jgi:YidC/Oxa1 family membrane protein insertase
MEKIKEFAKSFLIWFFVFYALLAGYEYFWGEKNKSTQVEPQLIIAPIKDSVVIGNVVQWKITNNLDTPINFSSPCETSGSATIFRIANDQRIDISSEILKECHEADIPNFTLQPGDDSLFSFRNFNHELFSEAGRYRLELSFDTQGETITASSNTVVELENPGIFRQLFRAIVSKPLFNLLVFLTDKLPGHPFGWAIVIMTFLVRLALFLPNQKAMRSQRELQKLQPKLEEIKRQYGKNQQMMAMKTMELYRTHKINPFSSCLPMLLQMPFLIGIYYIIRDGLSPSLSYLFYSFQANVDLTVVNTDFYGLDLSHNGPVYLAIIVGLAQWGAVKLSLISAKKKQEKATSQTIEKKTQSPLNQMQQMNKIMIWVMPVMIGWFTMSFPAGVGIYWLTSTLFGIFQQKYVNWQLDQPQVKRKESF